MSNIVTILIINGIITKKNTPKWTYYTDPHSDKFKLGHILQFLNQRAVAKYNLYGDAAQMNNKVAYFDVIDFLNSNLYLASVYF